MFNNLFERFANALIEDDRWQYIVGGLGVTFLVTFLALIMGAVIGLCVAVIRVNHDQLKNEHMRPVPRALLAVANIICRIYLTVIRGTPVMVQLLLMYFVFLINNSKISVAVICFGINSGAYIAEIFRGGILSIDKGQMEAARSLGLPYATSMLNVILPQALKNSLPALSNEVITLLKETSICGYIGLNELTRGGDIIRGITFDALPPLLTVAAIYLVIVVLITYLLGLLEKRLRKGDIR